VSHLSFQISGLAEAKLLKVTDRSAIGPEVLKDYSKCRKFHIKKVLKQGFCLQKLREK